MALAEYETLKYLQALLSTDAGVVALCTNVHAGHISSVADPEYPCITYEICASPDDRLVQKPLVEVVVFSQKSPEEKWEIFQAVEAALKSKSGETSEAFIVNARRVWLSEGNDQANQSVMTVTSHFQIEVVVDT